MMANPMLPLPANLRDDLVDHFLSLSKEDLRLRFGHALTLPSILAYVDDIDIDFDGDGVFCVVDNELRLVGVSHVALMRSAAEFGVSVLPAYRKRGIGSALFARAVTFARNRQVASLFVHCLSENAAMLRIAGKAGMRMARHGREVDAWLDLAPGDAATFAEACAQDQAALVDFTLKSQFFAARRLMGALHEASGGFIARRL